VGFGGEIGDCAGGGDGGEYCQERQKGNFSFHIFIPFF